MRWWVALGLVGCAAPVEGTVRLTVANVSEPGDLVASDGSVHDIGLAPGIAVVHADDFEVFAVGASASTALEAIAEDGDPTALQAELATVDAVTQVVVLSSLDDVDYSEAPLHPGESDSEVLTVWSDQRITFLQMFGASNDTFVAGSFSAFDGQEIAVGEVLGALALYDAGTEVNEDLGLGANQPANQTEPGQGEAEGGVIAEVVSGVPALASFLRVEIGVGE